MTNRRDLANAQLPTVPPPLLPPSLCLSDDDRSVMTVFASIVSIHSQRGNNGAIISALKNQKLYREPKHHMSNPFWNSDDSGAGDNFHARLHRMLSDPESTGMVEWLPHGRAWKVLDAAGLERSRLLVRYFRRGGMSFFMKEVNAWGFQRITKGADAGAYHHQIFIRGMPLLSRHVKRCSNRHFTQRGGERHCSVLLQQAGATSDSLHCVGEKYSSTLLPTSDGGEIPEGIKSSVRALSLPGGAQEVPRSSPIVPALYSSGRLTVLNCLAPTAELDEVVSSQKPHGEELRHNLM